MFRVPFPSKYMTTDDIHARSCVDGKLFVGFSLWLSWAFPYETKQIKLEEFLKTDEFLKEFPGLAVLKRDGDGTTVIIAKGLGMSDSISSYKTFFSTVDTEPLKRLLAKFDFFGSEENVEDGGIEIRLIHGDDLYTY